MKRVYSKVEWRLGWGFYNVALDIKPSRVSVANFTIWKLPCSWCWVSWTGLRVLQSFLIVQRDKQMTFLKKVVPICNPNWPREFIGICCFYWISSVSKVPSLLCPVWFACFLLIPFIKWSHLQKCGLASLLYSQFFLSRPPDSLWKKILTCYWQIT